MKLPYYDGHPESKERSAIPRYLIIIIIIIIIILIIIIIIIIIIQKLNVQVLEYTFVYYST